MIKNILSQTGKREINSQVKKGNKPKAVSARQRFPSRFYPRRKNQASYYHSGNRSKPESAVSLGIDPFV